MLSRARGRRKAKSFSCPERLWPGPAPAARGCCDCETEPGAARGAGGTLELQVRSPRSPDMPGWEVWGINGAFWKLGADLGAHVLADSAEARLVFLVSGCRTWWDRTQPLGSHSAQEFSGFCQGHPCLSFLPFKSSTVQGGVWQGVGESAACVHPQGTNRHAVPPRTGHMPGDVGQDSDAAAPEHVPSSGPCQGPAGPAQGQGTLRVGSDCPLCWPAGEGARSTAGCGGRLREGKGAQLGWEWEGLEGNWAWGALTVL